LEEEIAQLQKLIQLLKLHHVSAVIPDYKREKVQKYTTFLTHFGQQEVGDSKIVEDLLTPILNKIEIIGKIE